MKPSLIEAIWTVCRAADALEDAAAQSAGEQIVASKNAATHASYLACLERLASKLPDLLNRQRQHLLVAEEAAQVFGESEEGPGDMRAFIGELSAVISRIYDVCDEAIETFDGEVDRWRDAHPVEPATIVEE